MKYTDEIEKQWLEMLNKALFEALCEITALNNINNIATIDKLSSVIHTIQSKITRIDKTK